MDVVAPGVHISFCTYVTYLSYIYYRGLSCSPVRADEWPGSPLIGASGIGNVTRVRDHQQSILVHTINIKVVYIRLFRLVLGTCIYVFRLVPVYTIIYLVLERPRDDLDLSCRLARKPLIGASAV